MRSLTPLTNLPPELRTLILLFTHDIHLSFILESLFSHLPTLRPNPTTAFHHLPVSLFPATHRLAHNMDVSLKLYAPGYLVTQPKSFVAWVYRFMPDATPRLAEVLTAGREDMMRLHCGDVLKCFGRRENVDLVAFTDCDFNVEEMDEAGVGYI